MTFDEWFSTSAWSHEVKAVCRDAWFAGQIAVAAPRAEVAPPQRYYVCGTEGYYLGTHETCEWVSENGEWVKWKDVASLFMNHGE